MVWDVAGSQSLWLQTARGLGSLNDSSPIVKPTIGAHTIRSNASQAFRRQGVPRLSLYLSPEADFDLTYTQEKPELFFFLIFPGSSELHKLMCS